jgi:hypothetical protein
MVFRIKNILMVLLVTSLPFDVYAASTTGAVQQTQEVSDEKDKKPLDSETDAQKKEAKRKSEVLQAPLMLLIQYLEALKTGDSKNLKRFMNVDSLSEFNRFTFTKDSMLLEAQTLRDCGQGVAQVEGSRAVVKFGADKKMCAPYLMQFQEGSWRIDFISMSRIFVFNTDYEWRLNPKAENHYLFAFSEIVSPPAEQKEPEKVQKDPKL